MSEAENPNVAILWACLMAGRGYDVDWTSVAEAAVLCEQLVDLPPEEPADPAAGG